MCQRAKKKIICSISLFACRVLCVLKLALFCVDKLCSRVNEKPDVESLLSHAFHVIYCISCVMFFKVFKPAAVLCA